MLRFHATSVFCRQVLKPVRCTIDMHHLTFILDYGVTKVVDWLIANAANTPVEGSVSIKNGL